MNVTQFRSEKARVLLCCMAVGCFAGSHCCAFADNTNALTQFTGTISLTLPDSSPTAGADTTAPGGRFALGGMLPDLFRGKSPFRTIDPRAPLSFDLTTRDFDPRRSVRDARSHQPRGMVLLSLRF